MSARPPEAVQHSRLLVAAHRSVLAPHCCPSTFCSTMQCASVPPPQRRTAVKSLALSLGSKPRLLGADLAPSEGSLKVLVVDNAHRMADQPLLAVLLRLREMTGALRFLAPVASWHLQRQGASHKHGCWTLEVCCGRQPCWPHSLSSTP